MILLPSAPRSERPEAVGPSAAVRPGRGTHWLFILAIAVFGTGGVVTVWSTMSLLRARDSVTHTNRVLAEISGVTTAVGDVTASARGYALTGRPAMLHAYRSGSTSVYYHLDRLAWLTSDNPVQQRRLIAVRALVDDQSERAAQLLEARRSGGLAAASVVAVRNVDAAVIDSVQARLATIREQEDSLLVARRDLLRHQTFQALVVEVLLGVLSVLFVALAASRMLRERRALARAERTAHAARAELAASIEVLQQRTDQLTILSDLSRSLGICLTFEEFNTAVAATMSKAAPGSIGALGIINNSRTLVELSVTWGAEESPVEAYQPEQCCALRSGRPFGGEPAALPISCSHGRLTANHRALCVPLTAQGDTLGVLHLWMPAGLGQAEADRWRELVTSIAEHLALALATLRAHDALRHQATRDPLTGAFNRRFMLEALERELLRSQRSGRPVGLLMLDVDHFKRFNDEFGHQAGDEVLKLVVSQMRQAVRAEDYVCRYGGEEFAVILPEASAESAVDRAESLRQLVSTATRGREGGSVTVSVGVAVFPQHGAVASELIARADAALYAAKRGGRDRVLLAAPLDTQAGHAAA
ncbi:MAG TPA: diguanylate cyclase [Gemmatimonadales bacterium]|nr:diguanylate cyclase [Gemmatimonadales bacterium]